MAQSPGQFALRNVAGLAALRPLAVSRRGILRALLPLAARTTLAEVPELRIAAASNLTAVAPLLAAAFLRTTGIRAVFSFASTSQLARQIEEGAPFDVFAAADSTHVDELLKKNLIVPGTAQVYAAGVLSVWFPAGPATLRLEDLTGRKIRAIALARPELAPYGGAALDVLRNLGILERVRPRLVYAGSVAMAKQYGATGNADAVFVPASLVLKERGAVIPLNPKLHRPLLQTLGLVNLKKRTQSASQFAEFLVHGQGHAILLQNGYR